MHVLAIVGSLQQRSANRALVELAARLLPADITFTLAPSLDTLPHYNSDLDGDAPPPAVIAWRAVLRASDRVLIASPEYGHGVPGALKNALDWIVGSGELVDKAVAATCAAQAKGRGLLGLAALAQTLRAIDARVVASHPIVVARTALAADGTIADAAVQAEVRRLLATLLAD